MEKKFCPIDVHAMSSGLSCPWRYIIWKINSSLLSVDVCWIKVTKTYHTEETQKEPKQIFFTFVNGLNKCIKLFEIRKNIIALKCFWLTIRKLRSFFAIESDFCYLLPGVKIIFTKEHSWCYLCAEIKLTNCCAQTITISVRSFCEKLWNWDLCFDIYKKLFLIIKNGTIPASFCLFSSFSHYNFNNTNGKGIDGVLEILTCGYRMAGCR